MSAAEEGMPARRDWAARARSTIAEAQRYTKFVARMKRVLSICAFAIIFAVLGFFFVQRATRQPTLSYEKLTSIENDRAMLKPRLSGTDAAGNPFTITADELVQDAVNAKRATLKNVEADLTRKSGYFNARAAAGWVDMDSGQLELTGGIDIFTDSGYQLHTESASVNLHTNIAQGHQKVTGQGPLGNISGDSFRYDRNAGLLTLDGHVQTVITAGRT